MDSGDEAFNKFIEVSDDAGSDYEDLEKHGDVDSDKENSTKEKSKPTKLAQIDKIIEFVEEYNDQLIEKSVYDSLWSTLVEDLNNLGPPIYTVDKWRRVWSQYKYRNKRRFLTRQDEPSHSNPKLKRSSTDQPSITENILSSQMLKVLEKQDIILRTLKIHGTGIERNGHLLEEISKKIKTLP